MFELSLFSVLIANYNNGKYLMDAIDSVRRQTYTHWEIILVDDASTDHSKELYKELEKDERIHIYYNDKNHGCGYTKARCADLAHGELCGFLDPDDELLPNALSDMTEVHNQHPEVSVVYSRCYYCDLSTKEIIGENRALDLDGGKTFFDYRDNGATHFTSFKKMFYLQAEPISASIKAGVDQDMNFKLEEVGKPYFLNKFTYRYYLRSNSLSARGNLQDLLFWNYEVRHATCVRRGLDVSAIMQYDFKKMMDLQRELAADEVRHTKRYRIGMILLSPFTALKKKND